MACQHLRLPVASCRFLSVVFLFDRFRQLHRKHVVHNNTFLVAKNAGGCTCIVSVISLKETFIFIQNFIVFLDRKGKRFILNIKRSAYIQRTFYNDIR